VQTVAFVLWKSESGSGASLGACDARSVFGWIKRPVVQPTCLTGRVDLVRMLAFGRSSAPTVGQRGFRGAVNHPSGMDPAAIPHAIGMMAIGMVAINVVAVQVDDVLRKTQVFPGIILSNIVKRRCYDLRMVSMHGEMRTPRSDFGGPHRDIEYKKGIRWMPWHQEAMKDVARCEKPRGAASRR
jgi:hypothetical protein